MMKFKTWIHDHISQISMVATFLIGVITQNFSDTAWAGTIAAALALIIKLITPQPQQYNQPDNLNNNPT